MERGLAKIYLVIIVLIIIGGGAGGYLGYQNYLLKNQVLNLEGELSTTKNYLTSTIKNLNEEILRTKTERDDFIAKYNAEKSRMDLLASQIGEIEGQVGVLEKLSQTDPELLQKYSKVYFLNENYAPETLVKINPEYTYNPEEDYYFYSKTWPFLQDLLLTASSTGIDIKIISAFRSFGTQSELKSAYKVVYGSGANRFSADQGYSEHQLGTTVDFTTSQVKASFSGFEETEAYQWLLENGYKYGFILSYPEDNQYYQFEPWHWRFVGRSLAEKLHEEGKNFYDLDQREIDQYLVSFFD